MVVTVGSILGCEKQQPSAKTELLLFCGAGLRPPAAELAAVFARENKVKVVPDYAGAEVLLSKIEVSRRGDLYMPGDRHYVDLAAEKGLILSQRSVCYFVPTILVQRGNPKEINALEDLLKPGVKVGFGSPDACAIGRTTRKILAQNGIAWKDISRNVVFQSLTVNELGMQIQARSLDAIIIWDAMAEYFSRDTDAIAIPLEKNVISSVDIGVLKFTKKKEQAEKFVDFAASEKGRAILAKHKYRTEKPE